MPIDLNVIFPIMAGFVEPISIPAVLSNTNISVAVFLDPDKFTVISSSALVAAHTWSPFENRYNSTGLLL
jgi:hypothetical protein